MTTRSILQEWVTQLGLRHQGVLLTIIRGYDSWPKHCPEKPMIREMRGLILVPFDPRELEYPNGFMSAFPHPQAHEAFKAFCDNIDGLALHYVMHVVHATEIFAYCHGSAQVRGCYMNRYRRLAHKFHLNIETPDEMEARLTDDRVLARTVES